MQWRITHTGQGWVIEYKESFFGGWNCVIGQRKFSFEPGTPRYFSKKSEAAAELAKLIARYG